MSAPWVLVLCIALPSFPAETQFDAFCCALLGSRGIQEAGNPAPSHALPRYSKLAFAQGLSLGARARASPAGSSTLALNEAQKSALELLCSRRFADAAAHLKEIGPSAHAVLETYLQGAARGEGQAKATQGQGCRPTLDDRLELATALRWAQVTPLAGTVLEKTASAFPDSAAAHGDLGLLLSAQGQYREATGELARAVHGEPDSFKYSLGLAEALLSSKYNFTALKFLLSVEPRFKSEVEYHYMLGLAYYTCYRYPQAISDFEIVMRAKPHFDRIPYVIGNCYMAQGDLKTAETYFRKAVGLRPNNATYYAALGKMLRMEGPQRLTEAIQVLEQEQRLDPADAQSKYHLALCYESARELDKAQTLLVQVVHQKPDMLAAHIALARMYYRNGEKDKAARENRVVSRMQVSKRTEAPGTEANRPSDPPKIDP